MRGGKVSLSRCSYSVGIYARLSVDSDERKNESIERIWFYPAATRISEKRGQISGEKVLNA